jgi:spore coat protein U-like protein
MLGQPRVGREAGAMTIPLRLICALACASHAAAASALQCNVHAPPVNFGQYDTLNALAPAPVFIRVRCHGRGRASVSAALSTGSGSYATRTMHNRKGETLDYNLYVDTAHTQVAGDGSFGSAKLGPALIDLSGKNRVQTVSFPLYPYLPARQNVGAGRYTDTPIVVTLDY